MKKKNIIIALSFLGLLISIIFIVGSKKGVEAVSGSKTLDDGTYLIYSATGNNVRIRCYRK